MKTEEKNHIATPKYKVTKAEDKLSLRIALPGVAKEDLDLTTEDNQITLKSVRSSFRQEEWNLISPRSQPDEYRLNLRVDAAFDVSLTEAKFEKNILLLTVPTKVKQKLNLKVE